jgi:hypothetical protein
MSERHPLQVGDRVRHYGQQYTVEATGTIHKVSPGVDGWEYEVLNDKPRNDRDLIGYWHSSKTLFVSRPA